MTHCNHVIRIITCCLLLGGCAGSSCTMHPAVYCNTNLTQRSWYAYYVKMKYGMDLGNKQCSDEAYP